MKYEEYHQRLLAEKAAAKECPLSFSIKDMRQNAAEANQLINSLDQRITRAEIVFYRQHWWQFWRPKQPDK